jgi:glycerol-3-phosphate dehydrogenase (NAD(P)+)
VAEGYYTAQALREHADAFGVELPIVEGVFRILHENAAPRDILDELLLRDPKPELSPELLWGGREADS